MSKLWHSSMYQVAWWCLFFRHAWTSKYAAVQVDVNGVLYSESIIHTARAPLLALRRACLAGCRGWNGQMSEMCISILRIRMFHLPGQLFSSVLYLTAVASVAGGVPAGCTCLCLLSLMCSPLATLERTNEAVCCCHDTWCIHVLP